MEGLTLWKEPKTRILFLAGLGLCLLTAFFNLGIIALDDYDFVISQIIPAQLTDFTKIITAFEIRSPVHPIFLAAIGKMALGLGINAPTDQLRFILVCLTLITFSLNSIYGSELFENVKDRRIFLFLLGFYFLSPLFLSRPLIETAASPFITMGALYATRYWKTENPSHLAVSMLCLVVASVFRFQAGICASVIFILAFLKKDFKAIGIALAVGILGFIGTGLIDLFLTGRFHSALINYVSYNVRFSSEHYGTQPFYTFLLLFFALSLPPTFLQSYKGFSFRHRYQDLFPAVLFFAVFVLAHTLVGHKEERFMVPVLPLFMALLVPLLSFTLEKGWRHWRVLYFLAINFVLLPLTSFSTPQHNSVGLVRYLDKYDFVKKVIGVDSTLTIFPLAYASRTIGTKDIKIEAQNFSLAKDCSEALAVREDFLPNIEPLTRGLTQIALFSPGILEEVIVLANPSHNFRRDGIALYVPSTCAARFQAE